MTRSELKELGEDLLVGCAGALVGITVMFFLFDLVAGTEFPLITMLRTMNPLYGPNHPGKLAALVALGWAGAFQYQLRHRKDRRPGIDAALVEIEMILGALAAALVEFALLLGALLL